jgi:hypothetical protein
LALVDDMLPALFILNLTLTTAFLGIFLILGHRQRFLACYITTILAVCLYGLGDTGNIRTFLLLCGKIHILLAVIAYLVSDLVSVVSKFISDYFHFSPHLAYSFLH